MAVVCSKVSVRFIPVWHLLANPVWLSACKLTLKVETYVYVYIYIYAIIGRYNACIVQHMHIFLVLNEGPIHRSSELFLSVKPLVLRFDICLARLFLLKERPWEPRVPDSQAEPGYFAILGALLCLWRLLDFQAATTEHWSVTKFLRNARCGTPSN